MEELRLTHRTLGQQSKFRNILWSARGPDDVHDDKHAASFYPSVMDVGENSHILFKCLSCFSAGPVDEAET